MGIERGPNASDEHQVAARMFENLGALIGEDEQTVDASGNPVEDVKDPAEDVVADEDDFDAEAAAALRGESDEEEPEADPAEDEDEDIEDEAEPEEEDDESAEDDEVETYTVRVDGEDVEVTYDELLAGYSRTESWTRKSQALSRERKAFEAELQSVQAKREEYGAKLHTLEQHFAQAVPKEPAADAPDSEWIAYQRAQSQLEQVQAEQKKVYDEWQIEHNRKLEQVVEQETIELLEKVPEWKDEAVRTAGLKSLFTFATQTLGFDPETVKEVRDHRLIYLLKLAAEAEGLKGAKETVRSKTKRAKTLKPGNRPSAKSKARAKTKASRKKGRDALRESGTVRDAARAFDNAGLLDDLL